MRYCGQRLNWTKFFGNAANIAVYASTSGAVGSRERTLGFLTRSVFWLGLVYSSMPFEQGSAPAITPAAWPSPVSTCSQGMSEDCRNTVGRLRLATDLAKASLSAGDLLLRAPIKSRPADPLASKGLTSSLRSSSVRPTAGN